MTIALYNAFFFIKEKIVINTHNGVTIKKSKGHLHNSQTI
jgi:hypothetical protein